MSIKFVIAAVAASFLVASCGDDSGSGGGGGGTASGGSGMQAFVKTCQGQMEKQMGSAKNLEKLPKDLKAKVMGAARDMCGCVGKEVEASKGISAADKAKVFAMKDFKASAKPDISDASKKAFQEVGKKCAGMMMGVMMEVMKKAQEQMKNK
jgi:hypothetical protein